MSFEISIKKLKNEYEYLQKKKGIDEREFPLAFSQGYIMWIEEQLCLERVKNQQLSALLKEKQ